MDSPIGSRIVIYWTLHVELVKEVEAAYDAAEKHLQLARRTAMPRTPRDLSDRMVDRRRRAKADDGYARETFRQSSMAARIVGDGASPSPRNSRAFHSSHSSRDGLPWMSCRAVP